MDMDVALTLQDLLKLILFLLGIGTLGYLMMILKNINKTVSQAQKILETNAEEIDITVKQLPEITANINKLTDETTKLITEVSPDVSGVIHNVNGITAKVDDLAGLVDKTGETLGETVELLTDTIAETALSFQFNAKNVTNYIEIAKEIIEIVKNTLKKF
jgi:methyl-accepting chemotaxis protein